MAYDMYLGTMLLPVTPSKLSININNKNSTMVLINDGEINILKKAGLTEISFTALLPNVKYPFAVYKSGFQKASAFLDKLEELKTSQKPFQFIVSRQMPKGGKLFDTNIKVSLEDYKIIEDSDNGFDVNVDISLKQYRDYQTKTVAITIKQQTAAKVTATTSSTRSTSSAPTYKTYTIKSGDTLWGIAKSKLGSGSRYTEIYNLNKSTIEAAAKQHGRASSSNGNWIWPGTVLQLPN
jgi:LysM repeat protein